MVDSQYQSVLVRADTLELHVEATLVMQEHAGAIAVDRTVREQHTNGECGLHVLRQRQECLVGVPVRVVHHGGTGHVGVTVAILVDVSQALCLVSCALKSSTSANAASLRPKLLATSLALVVFESGSLPNISGLTMMTFPSAIMCSFQHGVPQAST